MLAMMQQPNLLVVDTPRKIESLEPYRLQAWKR